MRVQHDRSVAHVGALCDHGAALGNVVGDERRRNRHVDRIACLRQVGSKSRLTRLPITRFPTSAGSASTATSFTIAFAKLAEVITANDLFSCLLSLTNFRPADTPLLTSVTNDMYVWKGRRY
jgi:hypothetical protein